MKQITTILFILALVSMILITGCSQPSDVSETGQAESQLGVDDIGNELDSLDADTEDFDLTDLDNIDSDLGDL